MIVQIQNLPGCGGICDTSRICTIESEACWKRLPGTTWKIFFEAYWKVLAAIDFFSVEVLTFAR